MENYRILLVEDDLSFGSVLKDYLTIKDFDVTHAINGEDGLDKFKQGEFDICILDVMMPKKDGFTLAKEIKEIKSEALKIPGLVKFEVRTKTILKIRNY